MIDSDRWRYKTISPTNPHCYEWIQIHEGHDYNLSIYIDVILVDISSLSFLKFIAIHGHYSWIDTNRLIDLMQFSLLDLELMVEN